MIKANLLTCPICDKTLRTSQSNYYKQEKICSNKHHIIVFTFNDWDDLLSISLRAKDLHGNNFTWLFKIKKLIVERLDGKSSYELPWFEPDFYLYEKLAQKLNTYVIFS